MRAILSQLMLGLLLILPCLARIEVKNPNVKPDVNPHVWVSGVDVAKANQTIEVWIRLEPPNESPVWVTLIGDIANENKRVEVQPREHKTFVILPKPGPEAIAWIGAAANGYETSWIAVNVGFDGVLKFSSAEPLEFNQPTSLTLQLTHSDGKPFPLRGDAELALQTSDGSICNEGRDACQEDKRKWVGELNLPPLTRGSYRSAPFLVKSRSFSGGHVHLAVTLIGATNTLQQADVDLAVVPAWWFLLGLSIGGGLLHGVYALVSAPHLQGRKMAAIGAALVSSAIAGTLGFLLANFDVLGLKLDPNVLRTYPLLGLLFSYLGLGLLLSKFRPSSQSEIENGKTGARMVAKVAGVGQVP